MSVIHGDCLKVLPTLEAETFHSVVTDPPYHLTSIVKRFSKTPRNEKTVGKHAYGRHASGFMGKHWDGGDVAFDPTTWDAVLRVMKPGAFMVAFASTRGYHRMACAIEDAGFVIHPMLGWLFGSGFPKATRFKLPEMEGWRYGLQALKPALEPICLAQKPMAGTGNENWLQHGVGGLNIEACRIEAGSTVPSGGGLKGGAASRHEGWQRPAHLTNEATKTHNLGRWPANLLHDGSDEVLEAFGAFGESKPCKVRETAFRPDDAIKGGVDFKKGARATSPNDRGDSGTAARFFYSAKADADDRAGSKHPTVKPIDLVRWLTRLVTPPCGHILDPFAGSGTTGEAARLEGFQATLIEREAEYVADIHRRLGRASGADTPLFAEFAP